MNGCDNGVLCGRNEWQRKMRGEDIVRMIGRWVHGIAS